MTSDAQWQEFFDRITPGAPAPAPTFSGAARLRERSPSQTRHLHAAAQRRLGARSDMSHALLKPMIPTDALPHLRSLKLFWRHRGLPLTAF